jgi:hypothetical protein
MNKKFKVIRIAKMLAKLMTSSTNMQVTIHGNQAYRTPGHINVPMGDFTDPDIVAMTHGFIDHELGHEKHTHHPTFVDFANKSPFHKHMLNIIEDVRMEKAVGSEFPGAKRNLETLAGLAIKKELFQEPTHNAPVVELIQALCLYHGRFKVLEQYCVRDFAMKARWLLSQKLGTDVVDDIVSLIESTHGAQSTADSASIAEAIINRLEEAKDNADQDDSDSSDAGDDADADSQDDGDSSDSGDDAEADSQDDGDSSDSGDDADADSQDDGDSSDAGDDADADSQDDGDSPDSGDDAEADSQDDGDSSDSGDDADTDSQNDDSSDSGDDADADSQNDDSSDSGDDADADSQDDGDSLDSESLLKALNDVLGASDEDGLDDFHKAVAEMLEQEAKEAQDEGTVDGAMPMPYPICKRFHSGSVFNVSSAKAAGKRAFNALNRVLVDEVQNNPAHRNRGKRIDPRRLAGVPAGNDRIFTRSVTQQDTSAAISFIIDASGSMEDIMPTVNECAFAFANGFQTQGVVTETLYFSALGTNGLYLAKGFDEKPIPKRFQAVAYHGTPTGEAMMGGLVRLADRSEANKIMFVITDGASDDPSAVKKAREFADALDVRVIPIGINTGFIHGFDKEDFQSISSVSELSNAVKHAVREKLFKAA